MLDRLVHADRPVEHDATLGVVGRARYRDMAEPDGFGRDQDALRIHAVQDVFKTPPLLAEAILNGNLEILEEQLVRVDRLATHLLDLVHRDPLAIEVRVEQAQSVGRASHIVEWRGAGQK